MGINLNLVPENLRKRRKSKFSPLKGFQLPREVVIGLVGGLVGLLIFVHVFLQLAILFQYVQLKRYQGLEKNLAGKKIETDQVLQQLRKLQASLEMIDNISKKRGVYWAPKLNVISDNLGRGVWLERITYEKKTITIVGSAVSKAAAEMIEVNNVAAKLKASKVFAKDFKGIELGAIKTRKVNTTSVADFTLTATLK